MLFVRSCERHLNLALYLVSSVGYSIEEAQIYDEISSKVRSFIAFGF